MNALIKKKGGTFSLNKAEPIHRWYSYVEGYSSCLIAEELKNLLALKPSIETIYDPFCGTGTTSLVASTHGIKSFYSESKEFKTVMDSYDGYDTYKVDEKRYIRFNNSAFVSNYKRNDLLTTTMTLYCIPVGSFDKMRFDFIQEISKMERLISTAEKPQTLADLYPLEIEIKANADTGNSQKEIENVTLYDVLYACVTAEASNGG